MRRKHIASVVFDISREAERGAAGCYGERRCKRCGLKFVPRWPSSAYCPRCPTPGHATTHPTGDTMTYKLDRHDLPLLAKHDRINWRFPKRSADHIRLQGMKELGWVASEMRLKRYNVGGEATFEVAYRLTDKGAEVLSQRPSAAPAQGCCA